jgi:hypothetical protein
LSLLIDPLGNRTRYGAGKVDGSKAACAPQKAVLVTGGVVICPNSLAPVVYALKSRGRCAGKIKDGEHTHLQEKTVPNAAAIQKVAADNASVVNGYGARLAPGGSKVVKVPWLSKYL